MLRLVILHTAYKKTHRFKRLLFQSRVAVAISCCCGNDLSWYHAMNTNVGQCFNLITIKTDSLFQVYQVLLILKQF